MRDTLYPASYPFWQPLMLPFIAGPVPQRSQNVQPFLTKPSGWELLAACRKIGTPRDTLYPASAPFFQLPMEPWIPGPVPPPPQTFEEMYHFPLWPVNRAQRNSFGGRRLDDAIKLNEVDEQDTEWYTKKCELAAPAQLLVDEKEDKRLQCEQWKYEQQLPAYEATMKQDYGAQEVSITRGYTAICLTLQKWSPCAKRYLLHTLNYLAQYRPEWEEVALLLAVVLFVLSMASNWTRIQAGAKASFDAAFATNETGEVL